MPGGSQKNTVKRKETIKPASKTAKIKLQRPNEHGLTHQLQKTIPWIQSQLLSAEG